MLRGLPAFAAILVLIGSGIANGLWNDRWQASHELEEMAQRLPKVPLTIGDWVGKDDTDERTVALNDRIKKNGTVRELVARVYTNNKTGQSVGVLIATGKPGPISTHNPLTCVGGANGMDLVTKPAPTSVSIGDQTAVFTHCDFSPQNVSSPGTRIYWSWHDPEKGWVHTNNARVSFASQPVLTKIYVSRSLPPGLVAPTNPDQDAVVQFIKDCMPTIDAQLFKSS